MDYGKMIKCVNIVTLFPSGLVTAGNAKRDKMIPTVFKTLSCPPRPVGYLSNESHPTMT